MADRNLTFEDFKRLSPEERNRRYEELSNHDKFLARCSQPSGVHGVLCNTCIHRKRVCCKAFPDGIPGEHMNKLEENPAIECTGRSLSTKDLVIKTVHWRDNNGSHSAHEKAARHRAPI